MEQTCEEVRFSSPGGPVLAGSLALPCSEAGTTPSETVRSAVLMIGGSGPADRTNDGFFVPIRDQLLRGGAAVLTYDKRGAGLSEGSWHTADVRDLAADACAALALLERCSEVRSARTVVFGHSEGAWVGLRLAAAAHHRGRLVLNSCPSVAFLDAEVHALVANGSSPQNAARAGRYLAELVRPAAAGGDVMSHREKTLAVAHEEWFLDLEKAGFRLDDVSWAQLGAWGGYNPFDDLSKLRTPTMSLFGSEDPLVPVAASVTINQRTAAAVGRRHLNEVLAGLGHRMSAGQSQPVSPAFLEAVTAWCLFSG